MKNSVDLSIPLQFNTHNTARKGAAFNLLHLDAACKCNLRNVADHALHIQCPKLSFSFVGLPISRVLHTANKLFVLL